MGQIEVRQVQQEPSWNQIREWERTEKLGEIASAAIDAGLQQKLDRMERETPGKGKARLVEELQTELGWPKTKAYERLDPAQAQAHRDRAASAYAETKNELQALRALVAPVTPAPPTFDAHIPQPAEYLSLIHI